MTPSQVLNALGQHLLTLADCPPVIWPNRVRDPNTGEPIIPDRPYLVVQMVGRADYDEALAGGSGYSTGRAIIVVVHDLNDYSTQADDLAQLIKNHFPKALHLSSLRVSRSQVLVGYPTDTDWRVPVAIDWIAV